MAEAKEPTEAELIQEAINNQIDLVVEQSESILEAWEIKLLPLTTYEQLMNTCKILKPDFKLYTNKEKIKAKRFFKEYNSLIDKCVKTAKDTAKEMGTSGIPQELVKQIAEEIKGGFGNGLKSE